MKMITLLFLLTPFLYLSQVGINTESPTDTLDVNGTLRVRKIPEVNSKESLKDSIMVFERGGVVKRASANQIIQQADNRNFPHQQLRLRGNKLILDSGGEVDLSKYLNTDDQKISFNAITDKLSLTEKNSEMNIVDLSSLDNNGTDNQQLTLSGNTLALQDGGTVDLSKYVNTDKQKADVFKLEGDKLKFSLENDGEEDKEIDLSKYLDNTDNQKISDFKYDPDTHKLSLQLQNSDEKTVKIAAVPVGGIIMWSGSIDNIPSGWQLCNGQNGTPDLTDRFIVGAGANYSVGNTGGQNNVTLTKDQIPNLSGSVTIKKENVTYKDTQFRNSEYSSSLNFATEVNGNEPYSEKYHGGDNWHDHLSSHGTKLWIYYKNRNINKDASGTFQFNRSKKPQQAVENRPLYYALAFIMFTGN